MNKIKANRIRIGLLQAELAEQIGVSKSMISKYECGEITPPTDKLKKLAAVFEVEPVELMEDALLNPVKKKKNRIIEGKGTLVPTEVIVNFLSSHRCDLCGMESPFSDEVKTNKFFLAYFIDENIDDVSEPENIAILCPNCYQRMILEENTENLSKLLKTALERASRNKNRIEALQNYYSKKLAKE